MNIGGAGCEGTLVPAPFSCCSNSCNRGVTRGWAHSTQRPAPSTHSQPTSLPHLHTQVMATHTRTQGEQECVRWWGCHCTPCLPTPPLPLWLLLRCVNPGVQWPAASPATAQQQHKEARAGGACTACNQAVDTPLHHWVPPAVTFTLLTTIVQNMATKWIVRHTQGGTFPACQNPANLPLQGLGVLCCLLHCKFPKNPPVHTPGAAISSGDTLHVTPHTQTTHTPPHSFDPTPSFSVVQPLTHGRLMYTREGLLDDPLYTSTNR